MEFPLKFLYWSKEQNLLSEKKWRSIRLKTIKWLLTIQNKKATPPLITKKLLYISRHDPYKLIWLIWIKLKWITILKTLFKHSIYLPSCILLFLERLFRMKMFRWIKLRSFWHSFVKKLTWHKHILYIIRRMQCMIIRWHTQTTKY